MVKHNTSLFRKNNDDYRSFVCFLSMKINNPILSEDEIISIVSGISEIADDIETQRFLIKNYIETEAKGEMLVRMKKNLKNLLNNMLNQFFLFEYLSWNKAVKLMKKNFQMLIGKSRTKI